MSSLVLRNGKIILNDVRIGKFERSYDLSPQAFALPCYEFSCRYNERFFGGRVATMDEMRFRINECISEVKRGLR
jgi:hypothetical protein